MYGTRTTATHETGTTAAHGTGTTAHKKGWLLTSRCQEPAYPMSAHWVWRGGRGAPLRTPGIPRPGRATRKCERRCPRSRMAVR